METTTTTTTNNTNNIIIKDRYGNDVVYEGVSRIRTGTTDGGTKEFVIADDIPTPVETTVELDFSEGDMVIEPSGNTVYDRVIIARPSDLISSNIAEGARIAGIDGSHTGGLHDDMLSYFTYQIDNENRKIILWRLLYDVLYEKTGSLDVVIPNQISGYDVMISCL